MRAYIITPTFNAAPFIRACVENVAAQGDSVVEHIIADGGSTDGTVALVEELQRDHPHLRLLPGPDKGQSDAMNKATAIATGEVIGILNADDFYEPGAVAEAVALLSRQSTPAFVAGDCLIIDENGTMKSWNRPSDLRVENLLTHNASRPLPANPSAYFYHREVHDIVGGYDVDNHFAMDIDFVLGAAANVHMQYIARHWGNFRLIPGCKSFENKDGQDPVAPLLALHLAKVTPQRRRRYRIIKIESAARRLLQDERDRWHHRLNRLRRLKYRLRGAHP